MTDSHNTDCDLREALVTYLYNEATPEESRRIESHLTECPACKRDLSAFQEVRGMLQQWQIDDLPVVRVATEQTRSPLAILRELLAAAPVWAKAAGLMAVAMLVLAVMGTEISIGRGGFSARIDLLQRESAVSAPSIVDSSRSEALDLEQVRAVVNQMVIDNERQRKDEISAQFVSLQSQLSNMTSAELAKLTQRIREHQVRLKTIERDIDRREGLDLTDILFSELTDNSGRPIRSNQSGGR